LRFFGGMQARPQMSWSQGRARNLLGHYDPAHNAIVVSRIFDHPAVPRYAVEYIVYHEMLHLRHPVKLKGSRRCVHSAEFRAEAALIVGITLAYLTKIGRSDLRKSVFAALGAAFVGSIGVAVLVSRLHLNEDVVEGWVMLAAAFFVITMIIFMMRTGKKMKGEIEGKLESLDSQSSRIGVFLFVFLLVMREGVETVLILSAVTLNSTELLGFLGTLLGVVAAIAFGVMFVKGSVRIN